LALPREPVFAAEHGLPDEFADPDAVKLSICMRWFSSDAGQVMTIAAVNNLAVAALA
jgi:hypothetical protein